MKAVITGHTSGLGKALYDSLASDYEVIGLSSSNGHDISKDHERKKIVDICNDAQVKVIINCAHNGYHQVELLLELFREYKNRDKIIVNIGSISKDYTNADRMYPYGLEKLALHDATLHLSRLNFRCRVCIATLGRISDEDTNALDMTSAVDAIHTLIANNRGRTNLVEMTVTPKANG